MSSLGAIAIDTARTDAKRESRMDKQSPDGTHSNAIDLACRDDRLWFDWNLNCNYRLREVVTDEFPALDAPPHGMIWKVLVVKINHEVKVRTPVAYLGELPSESADDDYLAEIFKQSVAENVQRIAREVKWRMQTK
jgi:hypothetical protein